MKCVTVQDRLILYLKRELEPAEFRNIDNHLRNCRDCRQELNSCIEIDNLLKQSIHLHKAPAVKEQKIRPVYWVAAAAIVMLAFSLLIFFPAGQPEQSLAWENGQFDQLLELSNDLDRISHSETKIPVSGAVMPEIRRVERAVSYLEKGK